MAHASTASARFPAARPPCASLRLAPACRSYSVLSPGGAAPDVSYNEAILRGLDYVVDQARMHGLRVLLVFTDYFRDGAGGPLQYMT